MCWSTGICEAGSDVDRQLAAGMPFPISHIPRPPAPFVPALGFLPHAPWPVSLGYPAIRLCHAQPPSNSPSRNGKSPVIPRHTN